MSNRPIAPCIWLDHRAVQAAELYVRTFPGSRILATSHYPESRDNPSGVPRGSVLTVELEVAGQRFTALNGGPVFVVNPSVSFFFHADAPADVDRLYAALAEGGEAMMPLGAYPWSERYAWVKDRFGVSWQLMAGRRPASGAIVVPCLMFAGKQHGKADEAMRLYASIFPEGKVGQVERYAAGEGPVGAVKHGRFTLAGQELVAMDAHADGGINFNEGLSLQVSCDDQPELDRLWAALSEGGEPGPCGWLKDRFGLSWQIVPASMSRWMTGDPAARDRVFDALMRMKKLEIAPLERAFGGN